MRKWSAFVIGLGILGLGSACLRADVIDTFENGTNLGNWVGTGTPVTIQPSGGHPGGWLNTVESRGEPLFQFLPNPANVFAGDYATEGVTGFSVDLRADSGFQSEQPDGRGVTLRLHWTNNGEYTTGIEAYYTGDLLPAIGTGWHSYSFPVPATSPTIPAGWTIYEGDGTPGTDADWRYLARHIDAVEIIYGEIGYAFPIRSWNIGMDNADLIMVPEPASAAALLVAAAAVVRRRRTARA